uniref:Uncharacterized protein n=1 Tax=Noctiluca scintillans TaxID=2966 RepID=A0A7S1AZ14_NOCSC
MVVHWWFVHVALLGRLLHAAPYFDPILTIEKLDANPKIWVMVVTLPLAHFGEGSQSAVIDTVHIGIDQMDMLPWEITWSRAVTSSRHAMAFERVAAERIATHVLEECPDCTSGSGFCCPYGSQRSPTDMTSEQQSQHCLAWDSGEWEAYRLQEGRTHYTFVVNISRPLSLRSNDFGNVHTNWDIDSDGYVHVSGYGTGGGDSSVDLSPNEVLNLTAPGINEKIMFVPLVTEDDLDNAVLLPPESVDFTGETLVNGVDNDTWVLADMCNQSAGWDLEQVLNISKRKQFQQEAGNRTEALMSGFCLGRAKREVFDQNVSYIDCPFLIDEFYSRVTIYITLWPTSADSGASPPTSADSGARPPAGVKPTPSRPRNNRNNGTLVDAGESVHRQQTQSLPETVTAENTAVIVGGFLVVVLFFGILCAFAQADSPLSCLGWQGEITMRQTSEHEEAFALDFVRRRRTHRPHRVLLGTPPVTSMQHVGPIRVPTILEAPPTGDCAQTETPVGCDGPPTTTVEDH